MEPHDQTHPKVKAMMGEYYKEYNWIMGGEICKEAGTSIKELRLGKACLNFILGKCDHPKCRERGFEHPPLSEVRPGQVDALCNKLRPGVDKLTRQKRGRGGGAGRAGWRN